MRYRLLHGVNDRYDVVLNELMEETDESKSRDFGSYNTNYARGCIL